MGKAPSLKTLLGADEPDRLKLLRALSKEQAHELRHHWRVWARSNQLPPAGDWRLWLIMAGRGFGKTRAGAEWVRSIAVNDPQARIALVAASLAEARAVMVEGESGLIEICPPGLTPMFEPSLRRVTWPNGAQATLYSAYEPESLRGPQHSHAWCDEVSKWDNAGGRAMRCWDDLLMGLRLGEVPRVLATTTPRAVPLLKRIMASGDAAITKGSTEDNLDNLPARFVADIRREYGKTPVSRRRKSSSTKWPRGLMRCCTGQSRASRQSRPPCQSMARPGLWRAARAATGRGRRARSPPARREIGSTQSRATA